MDRLRWRDTCVGYHFLELSWLHSLKCSDLTELTRYQFNISFVFTSVLSFLGKLKTKVATIFWN